MQYCTSLVGCKVRGCVEIGKHICGSLFVIVERVACVRGAVDVIFALGGSILLYVFFCRGFQQLSIRRLPIPLGPDQWA